uniref:Conserved plasma membrane protein n=1 Tax=Toxocara canis TaxID=6265 RepID=A0A183VG87_TOXCA
LCSAVSAFIGLVFFIVGFIGVLGGSVTSKARDWIFLSLGIAMFATGLSLLVLCRIRANSSSSSSRRRPRNDATRPFSRRDPLPVWTIDAVDPTLRPPPDYYEAIHCSPSSPVTRQTILLGARPPAYTPSPLRQSRITDV